MDTHTAWRGDDGTEFRADFHEVRADRLAAPVIRDDGGMLVEMVTSTADEVLTYADASFPSGVRREYVPRETLDDPAYVASLRLRPVVVAPNDVHWTGVRPETVDQWRVGQTGEAIRWDGADQVVPAVVDSARGLDALRSGLRGVSVGYTVRVDATPGVSPSGQPYDVIQRDRRANHVLITQRGRAARATVRADEAESPMDPKKLIAALALHGITVRADAADEDGIAAAVGEALSTSRGEAAGHKQRADAADAEVARLKPTEAAARGDGADFLAAYAERGPLLALAAEHKIDAADTLGNAALRKAVAVKLGARADAPDAEHAGFLAGLLKARGDAGPTVDELSAQGRQPVTDKQRGDAAPKFSFYDLTGNGYGRATSKE